MYLFGHSAQLLTLPEILQGGWRHITAYQNIKNMNEMQNVILNVFLESNCGCQDWWFDPPPLRSLCLNVTEQKTENVYESVFEWVNADL